MPIRAGLSFIYILLCVSTLISLACGQRRVGLQGMLPLEFSLLILTDNQDARSMTHYGLMGADM